MHIRIPLSCLLLLSCLAFVQDQPLQGRILSALQTYYKNEPRENTYLQTDRSSYTTGQTIWFKVYANVYGAPATLSKIVYAQLLREDGKLIIQYKMPLAQGNAHGDMLLPDSLQSGIYQLRCFTAWMLNFEDSAVFHKSIYIRNVLDSSGLPPRDKMTTRQYHVQFFPEGGDLVDNITNNIAFKATDQDGLPVNIHGEVKDEEQALAASFTTLHDGMGKFSIHPTVKHGYHATIYFPDHSTQQMTLPSPKAMGIGLKIIEQTPDAVAIQVTDQETKPGRFRDLVLATCQNTGKASTTALQLEHRNNIFNISTRGFGTGILRLTLFDDQGLPQAERLVFLGNQQPLQLQLLTDTLSFNPKGKSSFTVKIKGADRSIDKTTLSVSVTDADRAPENNLSDNIYSALLLSSELKGKVYDPGYYFSSDADSVKEAMDLVMMTNGWRHFEWKKILAGEPPVIKYPVEDSLWLAGKIIDYKAGREPDRLLKMIIRQGESTRFIGHIEPDSNGAFVLKEYHSPGVSIIYIQEENTAKRKPKAKSRPFKIKYFTSPLDSLPAGIYVPGQGEEAVMEKTDFIPAVWKDDRDDYLSDRKGLLKAVIVKGRAPTKTDLLIKKYVSPLFDDGNSRDADLINNFYPNSLRLFDFLKGRFAGLTVTGTEDHPVFQGRGPNIMASQGTANGDPGAPNANDNVGQMVYGSDDAVSAQPYIYLDESHSSFQAIRNIQLNDIALIRFIPIPATMAPFNGAPIGVLAIYQKKWDERWKPSDITQDYDQYSFQGYSISREFSSPDYSVQEPGIPKTDHRSTLYWNPDLTTDSENNIHFRFYNSDDVKKIRIVAEGMDQQGRLVYLNKVIQRN